MLISLIWITFRQNSECFLLKTLLGKSENTAVINILVFWPAFINREGLFFHKVTQLSTIDC